MKALFIVAGLLAVGWFARDAFNVSYAGPKASAKEVLPTVEITATPAAASAWHKVSETAATAEQKAVQTSK